MPADLHSLSARATGAFERADWLDGPADRCHQVVAGTLPEVGRGWLAGTWLGHPVHPFIVSVPIGCWTSASLLDALGHRRAAQTLIGAGVLSVVPTAVTGLSDWVDTAGAERRVGFAHLAVNTLGTSLYAGSWLARRRGHHCLGVALAVAGAGVASAGGWLGGHLAYGLGVGVDTNAVAAGPIDWTSLRVKGPKSGRPVHSAVGPTPLVVCRQADGVKVLGERCSHRGGPLSEGQVDGDCITCPWHGSRFDLASGRVVRGPAVVDQPAYQTRELDGTLQVRRDEPRALRANAAQP